MIDAVISPFIEFAFMRRALVGCLALSLGAPPIGVFLMLRRMSLMGDAMSHAILPGAAIGYLLAGLSLFAMSLGGFAAGLAVALAAGVGEPAHDAQRGAARQAQRFLFAHDHRVVREFGRNNYVRWMDDQNVGVNSISKAREAVNFLTRSLGEQRLTLNSGKTKFLNPAEVAVHFQLEANKRLTECGAVGYRVAQAGIPPRGRPSGRLPFPDEKLRRFGDSKHRHRNGHFHKPRRGKNKEGSRI